MDPPQVFGKYMVWEDVMADVQFKRFFRRKLPWRLLILIVEALFY
jgi:hypothetical protein